MGMFLIYGLNTWLPQMMRQAGYPLGSSLSFLLMLNITAAIGALFAGAIADRIGAKIVISISYLMAAICIGLLTIKPSVTIIYLLIGTCWYWISRYYSNIKCICNTILPITYPSYLLRLGTGAWYELVQLLYLFSSVLL